MKWDDEKFFEHICKYNGAEIAAVVKNIIENLKNGEFYKYGSGKEYPSIRLYVDSLSRKVQIIGIEFYIIGTSEPGFHYWVNLKGHEKTHQEVIGKIREYLGEFKKQYPPYTPENPAQLPQEIRSILQIIHDHFSQPRMVPRLWWKSWEQGAWEKIHESP